MGALQTAFAPPHTRKRSIGSLGAATGRVGHSWGTPRTHPGYTVEPCPKCGYPEADGGYCPDCGASCPRPGTRGGQPLYPPGTRHGRPSGGIR